MQVEVEQFRADGYLIIKNAVPPERLQDLRLSVEMMVDGEKARALTTRKEGEPRGGSWYQSAQPRLNTDSITAETADVLDFCLGETTLGVSQQLLHNPPFTALTTFGALCSGLIDYGYTDWHRDYSSAEQAPLSGSQQNLMENGPGYVQWNIALYDDDVFWILPASHKHPTTEAQRRQLLLDPKSQLVGGVPVRLEAGDGVVYPNLMMHWGSNYTSRLRRTIHMGYRSFAGPTLPYAHQLEWHERPGFLEYASEQALAHFETAAEHYDQEKRRIAAALRTIISGQEQAFRAALARLHPSEAGRMVAVVLMCRIANKVIRLHRPQIARMSVAERRPLIDGSPPAHYAEDMARRFSADEAGALQRRFAELNRRLEADREASDRRYGEIYKELRPDAAQPPDFESRPLRTFNSEMPADFGVAEFIASWGA